MTARSVYRFGENKSECTCTKKREIRKFATQLLKQHRPDLSQTVVRKLVEDIVKAAMLDLTPQIGAINAKQKQHSSPNTVDELKQLVLSEFRKEGFKLDTTTEEPICVTSKYNANYSQFINRTLLASTPKKKPRSRVVSWSETMNVDTLKTPRKSLSGIPQPKFRSAKTENKNNVTNAHKINVTVSKEKPIQFPDSLELQDSSMRTPKKTQIPQYKIISEEIPSEIQAMNVSTQSIELYDSLEDIRINKSIDNLIDSLENNIIPLSPKKSISYFTYIEQNKTSSAPRKRKPVNFTNNSESKVRKSIFNSTALEVKTEPKLKIPKPDCTPGLKSKKSISFMAENVPQPLEKFNHSNPTPKPNPTFEEQIKDLHRRFDAMLLAVNKSLKL